MSMRTICEKKLCCGCEACKNICPKIAINMNEDEYGAKYPEINYDLCINCGLCQKVCPQLNKIEFNDPKIVYAAKRKDEAEKLDSASGGIGSVLYENFLKDKEDSVIFGVEFDSKNSAKFLKTSNINDIENFKGSKYVQADVGKLYTDIIECLRNEKNVLVIGTPCQIAAINRILEIKKIKKEKIITVDLICHGVSPSKYLDEEITFLKNKYKWKEIKRITFRSNRTYRNFHLCVDVIDRFGRKKNYNRLWNEDPYFYAFLKGISLRENCYNCKYATKNRVSDITIGDFIGLGKHKEFPEYKDNSANASIILCNTEKGKKYIKKIHNDIRLNERSIEEALIDGISLKKPFPKHELRNDFFYNYKKYGFIVSMYNIAKKDLNKVSKKERIVRPIKVYIGKILDRKKGKYEK